jgi:hypothetical protein
VPGLGMRGPEQPTGKRVLHPGQQSLRGFRRHGLAKVDLPLSFRQ